MRNIEEELPDRSRKAKEAVERFLDTTEGLLDELICIHERLPTTTREECLISGSIAGLIGMIYIRQADRQEIES